MLVLKSIVCLSIRICDNSLLVLKMRFQVFSFVSKKLQSFSSDNKLLILLLSVLFHPLHLSQFFEISIFSQDV